MNLRTLYCASSDVACRTAESHISTKDCRDVHSLFDSRLKHMSLRDPNSVNSHAPKRVAIVISNPAVSTTSGWPVGFWWAELSHPFFKFTEAGYEVEVFSPKGGPCQADAMSDPEDPSEWQAEDV